MLYAFKFYMFDVPGESPKYGLRKLQFLESMTNDDSLCKTITTSGAEYDGDGTPRPQTVTHPLLSDGSYGKAYNDTFSIKENKMLWMLCRTDEGDLPSKMFLPYLDTAVAIAITSDDKVKHKQIEVLCATSKAQRGDGKLLFDLIVADAAAHGVPEVWLMHISGAEKAYLRYGMRCDGRGALICYLPSSARAPFTFPINRPYVLSSSPYMPLAAMRAREAEDRSADVKGAVSVPDIERIVEHYMSRRPDADALHKNKISTKMLNTGGTGRRERSKQKSVRRRRSRSVRSRALKRAASKK